MAMIKVGKFCLKEEKFDLEELTLDVIEMFQLLATRKGI
jgi:hypothetical protein